MAKVEIESGRIVRIIENYGFVIEELISLRNGDEAKRYYTVWTKDKYEQGTTVRVSGDLSVKLDEYTGKDNVLKVGFQVSINNPLISATETAPF